MNSKVGRYTRVVAVRNTKNAACQKTLQDYLLYCIKKEFAIGEKGLSR